MELNNLYSQLLYTKPINYQKENFIKFFKRIVFSGLKAFAAAMINLLIKVQELMHYLCTNQFKERFLIDFYILQRIAL